mmetsp:Transcript_4054/g.15128  ORF Transcript_4054/g.15128 Transcript_4054/m.15128 type:complete len:140 (-) Transcript_4054:188-607(-)
MSKQRFQSARNDGPAGRIQMQKQRDQEAPHAGPAVSLQMQKQGVQSARKAGRIGRVQMQEPRAQGAQVAGRAGRAQMRKWKHGLAWKVEHPEPSDRLRCGMGSHKQSLVHPTLILMWLACFWAVTCFRASRWKWSGLPT